MIISSYPSLHNLSHSEPCLQGLNIFTIKISRFCFDKKFLFSLTEFWCVRRLSRFPETNSSFSNSYLVKKPAFNLFSILPFLRGAWLQPEIVSGTLVALGTEEKVEQGHISRTSNIVIFSGANRSQGKERYKNTPNILSNKKYHSFTLICCLKAHTTKGNVVLIIKSSLPNHPDPV